MDLETRIASHHWDRVACRDTQKTYNLVDATELQALAPSFDFTAWSTAARIPAPAVAEVVVAQPSFLQGLAELLVEDELPAWRDWLRWQVVHSGAPYLSSAFVDANFEFYGRTLSGTDELRPRWKRGVGFVESAMGEAVGKIYVRTEFPPAAKERMSELIDHLIEAYRESIRTLPWMSDATKERALEKLDSVHPEDRPPRGVQGLLRPGDRSHRPARQRPPSPRRRHGSRAGQDRLSHRPQRVVHDPPDGQRVLQPDDERDRLPGGHPAAAVLPPGGRRRGQLRRDRRGHRPRDRPRIRRPGLAVRRHRAR